ncbi:MAG: type IV pilus assembly protein PilM [Hallerella porci]|uniref:Type IV pilus assembly protein PilM n=1 Tax=Hallerella porci TaxID=1945871 RepID=A0ABX5LIU9_9BACT|nr:MULTISPECIES: type IV pilus assembly protein PilM [Hallerella]MCI5600087.1 type IV pilus assembly protein PilM [Hallerella sp.]MDY3920819.1 type IV pilus assembly protein PilM [Hallerella porci]PWK93197.1 type IV pilus assembly protein PilM [Hallerella porci]
MALNLIAKIRGERQTIGVDIGHYSIKVVRVHHDRGNNYRVMAMDMEPTPEGAFADNEIQDEAKLREALIRLMTRNIPDASKDDLVTAVGWSAGILADKSVAKVPKNGNEDAIVVQTAQARPPFDDQDIMLDYQVIERDNKGEVKSLVVAAKNKILSDYSKLFASSGYKLTAIDVDVFGIANAYVATTPEDRLTETVALLDIGEKKSTLTFLRGKEFHSVRTLTSGSVSSVIATLSRHLGIDAAMCHEMFEKNDLTMVKDRSVAEVESALQLAYEEVVNSVEFGIRYFSSSESGEKPVRLLLCGGGANLSNICDYLKEKLSIECDVLNPFTRVQFDAGVVDEAGLSVASANIYTPALGLALRKF